MSQKPTSTSAAEYIYGTRAILEALASDREIERVLLQKGLQNPLSRELLKSLADAHVPVQMVPAEKLNQITRKNHQGALAFLSPFRYANLEHIVDSCFRSGRDPLFVAVDEVTDVRNMGAIIRNLECFGADALLLGRKGNARLGADAVKTSAGALNRVPVCRADHMPEALRFLRNSGFQVIAASEKGAETLETSHLTGPAVLLLGSEEKGISAPLLKLADSIVKIPMSGSIASLNVAVTAGIFLYELRKQRGAQRN